jgi:hypothetical protein
MVEVFGEWRGIDAGRKTMEVRRSIMNCLVVGVSQSASISTVRCGFFWRRGVGRGGEGEGLCGGGDGVDVGCEGEKE